MNWRILAVAIVCAVAPITTGCSSMSHTGQDALVGGGLGAVSGAIIDKATGGKGGTGAIVGGIAGAAIGGAIGNEKDQKEKAVLQAQAVASANQMRIDEVIQMSQSKLSDDVIITRIRTTNSAFNLTADDLRMLSTNGVSDAVINEMQSRRPEAYPRTRYVAVPAGPPPVFVQPAPVYVYGPPPPPIGVGVIIRR
jgi:Glycine zipper